MLISGFHRKLCWKIVQHFSTFGTKKSPEFNYSRILATKNHIFTKIITWKPFPFFQQTKKSKNHQQIYFFYKITKKNFQKKSLKMKFYWIIDVLFRWKKCKKNISILTNSNGNSRPGQSGTTGQLFFSKCGDPPEGCECKYDPPTGIVCPWIRGLLMFISWHKCYFTCGILGFSECYTLKDILFLV